MTVDIEGCERLGGDAGRGRQVTMRDGISALNSVRDPPFCRQFIFPGVPGCGSRIWMICASSALSAG
jgi:hypothetical protein